MTEEEAKKALFQINFEYMMHTPNERLELYDEYIEKRAEVRRQLTNAIMEKKEKNIKKI